MNGMTILMIAHNEAEYLAASLQSIRLFADVENLSVVVVDNHSDDSLMEWADAQEDITYIYMDEGELPFGQIVNKVCRTLQLQDDLLIMDPHYMLTPHALSRLQDVLYREDSIGAVGGMSNSFLFYQADTETADYEAAVNLAASRNTVTGKQVLLLHSGVILLKSFTFWRLRHFDEELLSQEYVLIDFCLRMVTSDLKQYICHEALFWDMRGSGPYHSPHKSEYALLKSKWRMHYFQTMYNEYTIDMITENRDASFSVLEVGCDCGATLLEIHNRYPNAVVCGCEINGGAAAIASHIANVQTGNIEDQNLDFAPHSFDYIIFGDVLEHLHDPLRTIQYCRSLLKESGCILACIPNLMHISVIEQLLQGNFTYTETGLLDKTHIHFFTYNEIKKMFETGGYKIEQLEALTPPVTEEQENLIDRLLEMQSGVSRFMYQAFWYVVRARY